MTITYTTNKETGEKYTKPLIKIIGGKTKIRGSLYKLFPEYHTYIEPFLGSSTVLTGNKKSNREIASDINPHIINFFQCIKNKPEETLERLTFEVNKGREKYNLEIPELGYGLSGRKEFEFWRGNVNSSLVFDLLPWSTRIFHATAFYIVNKSCLNGIVRWNKSGKCNSAYCKTWQGRGWVTPEWFWEIYERIKDVEFYNFHFKQILCMPIEDMEFFGCPTFSFLDPPYVNACQEVPDGNCTTYNGVKFTLDDQRDLFNCLVKLNDIKNQDWMLTINDCKWIRSLYKDFYIRNNAVTYSCSVKGSKGRGGYSELIITNYRSKNE